MDCSETADQDARVFFIFGCARSGTSLLTRLLDSHPNIAVPPESHVYRVFAPIRRLYGDLDRPQGRGWLLQDILDSFYFRDWIPTVPAAQALERMRTGSLSGVLDGILSAWAAAQGKSVWGEKTPAHVYHWHEINDYFTQARVIHIVRDGRDVAQSLIKARFGPKTAVGAARAWKDYLAQVAAVRAELPAERWLEIHYEALLADPESVLKQVCSFLGEPYSPDMLNFHTRHVVYRTDSLNMQNLQRPLITENAQRWRSTMSARDVQLFEAIAGELLEAKGYSRSDYPALANSSAIIWQDLLFRPMARALAVLKNRQGIAEELNLSRIRLRRLLDALCAAVVQPFFRPDRSK